MRCRRVELAVETRAPTGRVNAYVLESGGTTMLVDPGTDSPQLRDLLEQTALEHVLVTHHHPDHVGAVAEYADGATVWARAGREADFEAATGVTPDRTVGPGTAIDVGPERVEILDAPGHAPEHVAVAFDGGMLVGDLAVAAGSVVVGAPEGDMRAYLSSLRRLFARDPDRLYPGHGPVIEEPRATLSRLLRHRLERERRIERAVLDGAETVEAVLHAAYEKDLTGVQDLARATAIAHLEKLAVESRVRWDGQRARPPSGP